LKIAALAIVIYDFSQAGIKKCNTFVMDDNVEGRRFWEYMGWYIHCDLLFAIYDLRLTIEIAASAYSLLAMTHGAFQHTLHAFLTKCVESINSFVSYIGISKS